MLSELEVLKRVDEKGISELEVLSQLEVYYRERGKGLNERK